MKKFKDILLENEIAEQDIKNIVDETTWDDIVDLYDDDDFEEIQTLSEKISASSRMKKGAQMKNRSARLSLARSMKLRRSSTPEVLTKRAKESARRALMKKFLQGKDKSSLSAQERDRIEGRVKSILAMQPTMIVSMVKKVRDLERSRMSNKGKK